jgi:hypothetical protein
MKTPLEILFFLTPAAQRPCRSARFSWPEKKPDALKQKEER